MLRLPKKSNKLWQDYAPIWQLGLSSVRELETDEGILASSRGELYGCIFGRDTLITCLKLLKVYQKTGESSLLTMIRKSLLTLCSIQGTAVNVESGEEPGKCIHEYRPANHEHLTKRQDDPWYVYPDNVMRNFDSVDATPLLLIALYRYAKISREEGFLEKVLPNVRAALAWTLEYGDSNDDGFIDYIMPAGRTSGGILNQSWMDSKESTFHEDGTEVVYPLAPVEAQAYIYLAWRLWAGYFTRYGKAMRDQKSLNFGHVLLGKANRLKALFNRHFVVRQENAYYLAAGLDGNGKPLKNVRSSMGHCLWACLNFEDDGTLDCIVKTTYIHDVVKRLMKPDMFAKGAGIRTLSTASSGFDPNRYHNGSIWPHDNSMIAEGFEYFGYKKEARLVRMAILNAISHFNSPVELYVFDDAFQPYQSTTGQTACHVQAWSAAAILRSVVPYYHQGQKLISGLVPFPFSSTYLELLRTTQTQLKLKTASYLRLH